MNRTSLSQSEGGVQNSFWELAVGILLVLVRPAQVAAATCALFEVKGKPQPATGD